MNQYEILLISIGLAILIAGMVMAFIRVRGWLAALSVGGLWLFGMALYAIYKYSGFYSPTGGLAQSTIAPAMTTILGFLLFLVGVGIFVYVYRRIRR
ncbi:MAG: hypothetical protein RQ855_01820 [Desulfurococcales archaeon]|jgi:hypothetical protein|nr:hypothetical protein [Desulfurococcales archaeon]